MASSCKRRICSSEKLGFVQDPDSWRSKLIACVGAEKFAELLESRIVGALTPFKDYKPASVSNWSFDENCLFCCLRREKVKDHVIALNNKIVESGGKPLLGKDLCNLSRLEGQVEEFLNAVLHRKEYTPRIPDPHIPVVACDTMQQMLDHLVVHHTSNNKNSQDSPQHNGMDQSPLTTHPSTSPVSTSTPIAAASTQNPVLSKLLMEDQDAPLDLSVKKVRQDIHEQDCVLDLSIKKNRNSDSMLPRSPVNSTPVVKRQASGFAKARDLKSSPTLDQFMAKLCLHHQRQIVDAFGFLQSEIKAMNSSSEVQASTPAVPEVPVSADCTDTMAEIQDTEEHLPAAGDPNGEESPVSKIKEVSPAEQQLNAERTLIASIKNGSSVDLGQADVGDNDGSDVECSSSGTRPKCPPLLIVKNNLGNLEAKKLSELGSVIQEPNAGTLEQDPCASDMPSHTDSVDLDTVVLSGCPTSPGLSDPKCLPLPSNDTPIKPSSIQRTTNVISPNSSRTAKKSSRGSHPRLGAIGNTVNDPDFKYDIVYVGKSIIECKLQTPSHMPTRRNARKSTRGHLSFGDCLEIKTVRTLAPKSVQNGIGSYPVPMPEITTSITPKQALAKPDGLPAMTVPFTADCMETVRNKNLSDQSVVSEVPGDVVEIASEDFIVEPSQTGQTQRKGQIPCLLTDECDPVEQQDSNVGRFDVLDDSEKTLNSTVLSETSEKVKFATKETIDAPESSVILGLIETEVHDQHLATEALLNTDTSSIDNDASEAEGSRVGTDLKSPKQTKCLTKQVLTCRDNSTILQNKCGTEVVDSTNPDKVESSVSTVVVKARTTKDQLEECRQGASESSSPKKGVAKQALPSDRCLRSGVSKAISEQTSVSDVSEQTKLAVHEKNIPESKLSSKSSKLKQSEENRPCPGGKYDVGVIDLNSEKAQQSPVVKQVDSVGNKVCTRQKQKLMMVKEMESDHEQNVQELPSDKLKDQMNNASENEANALPQNGESPEKNSPGKSVRVSERMPLRNRRSQSPSPSPSKNVPHTPERMPLRSRNSITVDQPAEGDSPGAGHVEKSGRMPLRNRNSGFAEQTVGKDSCVSPNSSSVDGVARMPLRTRNSAVSRHISEGSSVIKDESGAITDQSNGEDSDVTSKKPSNAGHMPLRRGSGLLAEQSSTPNSSGSDAGTVSESPGRMSLRRSNTLSVEKQDSLQIPVKRNKLSPGLTKMSRPTVLSLDHKGEPNINSANAKTATPLNDQLKISSIQNSLSSFTLPTTSALTPAPCKFLEALNSEANQHLISELNSKFEKMQKGWVQMDKEGQPAPKPKNKSDRLKEIWKSKRRTRKPRSLEQQRFSPVQMLFMKPFDLPNICRWFLQSTETQSLVIVKKVNTRLPSETHLGFHTLPSMPDSSDGIFPSLQAERLKKHLKKFAIASPVKSNPKNKRLIAKALAQGISKGKDKREHRTATRISSKPQNSTGPVQPLENHSKVAASAKNPGSAKNPASARILRKYSNMREKRQVHQNSLKKLKRSLVEGDNKQSMTKKMAKERLSTRRGPKSAIVKKVKRLTKKAKTPAAKQKVPKAGGRGLRYLKGRISSKRVLPRLLKSKSVTTPKTASRKETPLKADHKKSPLQKGPESLTSLSQTDVKPLLSEDQVLTRSQRKMEATLAQTGSPKASTKRGMESSATPAKRTRTSK